MKTTPCPSCKRNTFAVGACWDHKCGFRPCEACGRGTGSPFIGLCLLCDMKAPEPQQPPDPEFSAAIAYMIANSKEGKR